MPPPPPYGVGVLKKPHPAGGCSEFGTGDCIGWGLFKAYAP